MSSLQKERAGGRKSTLESYASLDLKGLRHYHLDPFSGCLKGLDLTISSKEMSHLQRGPFSHAIGIHDLTSSWI
jgi:hypothetical protein